MQVFKTMGYQVVPMGANDMVISLTSGMVDAMYMSPILIGSLQLFGTAKYMSSMNLAPFMGGLILNGPAWKRVPNQYKDRVTEACRKIAANMDVAIQRLENDAVTTMVQYGLVVNKPSPQQEALWYADIEASMPSLLGTTFDRDVYNKINAMLKAYRSGR
jgi:TRAP-type C4-dicarboxylate transport system substrate-binding protein